MGESEADAGAILPIVSTGDKIRDRALSALGGKGLFTKEIEAALISGEADIAVHSLKDMPTDLPDGLVLGAYLPRADCREAFISAKAPSLADLPQGARLGAASLRRRAQALRVRPDLEVVTLRGNVSTRIHKAETGEVDATFLAAAGLTRLGKLDHAAALIETNDMTPALCQGIVCVEARAGDEEALAMLAKINDPQTELCAAVERSFLAALDGSCRTPIAGLAEAAPSGLRFVGEIFSADGKAHFRTERAAGLKPGQLDEARQLGADAGAELRAQAGPDFFARLAKEMR